MRVNTGICRDCSQSVAHGPAALALPGSSLEMQILGDHPRPTESETQKARPPVRVGTNLPGNSGAHLV